MGRVGRKGAMTPWPWKKIVIKIDLMFVAPPPHPGRWIRHCSRLFSGELGYSGMSVLHTSSSQP